MTLWVLVALLAAAPPTAALPSERLLLSGESVEAPVAWEFRCSEGRRCGEWTTIPVPSHWEQHGFGAYNYGHDDTKSREQGQYLHRFEVPERWRGWTVELVFEGVMTDTQASLNGAGAGPVHRGGFYRFRYDVSELLRYGGDNLLEVTVRKHSSNRSVNRAERQADYWVFGGIYRPVYLEASPPESIERLAIDARGDGRLTLDVFLRRLDAPARLVAHLTDLEGVPIAEPLTLELAAGWRRARLSAHFPGARPWSAEHPDLHRVEVELRRGGETLHRAGQRFGFRSVELRPGQGLYVNGRRTLLKGVNRHVFHPSSGRATSPATDRRDAAAVKRLNFNAVRASHYPPDPSFLDACDELGIYVLDELAGWHDAYDTEVGRRLVRETVLRDAHHPSVLFWDNGNEGGWNTALDEVFAEHDLQGRPVLHPDDDFGGFDSEHYPSWEELEDRLDPTSWRNRWRGLFGELSLVMPTEMLHGLYDGGSGAGLESYWNRLRASPRAAGAFLWAFTDEALERRDAGDALDTDGNHAPDGVLGPYREATGTGYAVRDIFSPVQVAQRDFNGRLVVENRFDATDLAECSFAWNLLDLPDPGEDRLPGVSPGGRVPGPAVPPGGSDVLPLPLPPGWWQADALRLTAHDPAGRELWTWVLPIGDPRARFRAAATAGSRHVEIARRGGTLALAAAGAELEIDAASGELLALAGEGRRLSLGTGPHAAHGSRTAASGVRAYRQGDAAVVEVVYEEGLRHARWTMFPSGWVLLSYRYETREEEPFHGVGFELAEERVEKVRWLGRGPARVWRNRLRGTTLGVWEKHAARSTPVRSAAEPKLRGFYADVHWARLTTAEGELLLALGSEDLSLGLFSPAFPEDSEEAIAQVPSGLTILGGISAIGTKFHPPEDLGPTGQPHPPGLYHGSVWLRVVSRASPGR